MVDNKLNNLGILKADDYVAIVRQVWGDIHPRRTTIDYLLHVLDHASKLGEAIRRDDAHCILRETAETTNWLFGFVAKLNDKKKGWERVLNVEVPLSRMIWGKYPNLCPHCFERVYVSQKGRKSGKTIAADIVGKCKYCLPDYPKVEIRAEGESAEYEALRVRAGKKLKIYAEQTAAKRPKTLKEIEEMFQRIYHSNVALSTIESIGFHALEEAGEIGRAVIDAYTRKKEEPEDLEEKRQALCDEIAEVFSWLCSLTLKVQMGATTFDRYRSDIQPEIKPRLPPETTQSEGVLANKIGLEEILWITYRNPRTRRYGCPYCGKKKARRPSYPCKCSVTFAWERKRTKTR